MHRLLIVAFCGVVLSACSKLDSLFIDEPIAAGIDSPDQDVAEHLQDVLQSARTMPDSALMRGRLGMAYDVNGLRDTALASYAQAEALDPADFRWPYFSAILIAETGAYEQALEVLQRALAIDAQYAPAWLWQGAWLLEAGRPDAAMQAFERAAAGQTSPFADVGRARVMLARGQHQQAIDVLQPIAQGSNHPFLHRIYGEALRGNGQIDEAREALAKGKDALPLTWPDERRDQRNVHVRGHASYEFAKRLSASGQLQEALTIFKRLQVHHPENDCGNPEDFFLACNLMNSVAIAQDRAGYPIRALEILERGLGFNDEFIPFYLTSSNLYRLQGDLARALDHVDDAIRLNPARGYAHEQRGRLLFGLQRFAEAKASFEAALQYEAEKQTTLFYLGLAEFELNSWAEAVTRFEGVIRLDSSFALGHVFLARSLAELGQMDEARAAHREAEKFGADPAELRSTEARFRTLEANQ